MFNTYKVAFCNSTKVKSELLDLLLLMPGREIKDITAYPDTIFYDIHPVEFRVNKQYLVNQELEYVFNKANDSDPKYNLDRSLSVGDLILKVDTFKYSTPYLQTKNTCVSAVYIIMPNTFDQISTYYEYTGEYKLQIGVF